MGAPLVVLCDEDFFFVVLHGGLLVVLLGGNGVQRGRGCGGGCEADWGGFVLHGGSGRRMGAVPVQARHAWVGWMGSLLFSVGAKGFGGRAGGRGKLSDEVIQGHDLKKPTPNMQRV